MVSLTSVEIVPAADVAVAQGLMFEGLVDEGAIQAVLEDGADRGDGSRLDQKAASAGGVDALGAVAIDQRQNAEAGAKALLGMGPGRDHGLEEGGGRRTDPLAGGDHAGGRPLAVAPMGAGHVVGDGGVAPPVGRAGVAGDPVAVVEYLDRPVVDACIDELTDEPVWRGIPGS